LIILKKIFFISILLILSGCSLLITNDEIGSAKNFSSIIISAVNNTQETPSQTEIIKPTSIFNETTGSSKNYPFIVHSGPGNVNVPILLYHHVLMGQPTNPYSISVKNFEEQLAFLRENGYFTISISQLIKAITVGTDLPEKSVILTFDDGNENIYLNAYPLMKKNGFTGVIYVIANRINADGFLTEDQIKELLSAGWEIGSHGMKHIDLVLHPDALRDEIGSSKKKIEGLLGIRITSFAYPFGMASKITMDWVKQIGYLAGMGLGISNQQNKENIYYLNRRQVESDMSISDFSRLLLN
jgi:peptidoglycan/xylan/chitin deacetylase (PgdA/CDA1 family)